MRTVDIQNRAVSDDVITSLLRAATSSERLGPSQLVGTFGRSFGFGVVFSRRERAKGLALVPALAPFFDLVLDDNRLQGSLQKSLAKIVPRFMKSGQQSLPNAFYVNALVLFDGVEVGPHIDGTLGPALGDDKRTPAWVSVLYLEVPSRPNGALVLSRGPVAIAEIEPEVARRVTFDGSLGHRVCEHVSPPAKMNENAAEAPRRRRVSLVCEHYFASDEELERLGAPRMHSRSRGPLFPSSSAPSEFAPLLRTRRPR